MKQPRQKAFGAKAAMRIWFGLILISAGALVIAPQCAALDDESAQEFVIPTAFDPNPGKRTINGVLVSSDVFGFSLDAEWLAKEIEPFDPGARGADHSMMVVVTRHGGGAETAQPATSVIERREAFWRGTGYYAGACSDAEPDLETGLVRYHVSCDDPTPSTYYLLTLRPDPNASQPDSQEYIRARCKVISSGLPGLIGTRRCKFFLWTERKEKYQFTLFAENVKRYRAVGVLIEQLLEEWRLEE